MMTYLCFGINDWCARGGMLDCYLVTDDLEKAEGWLAVQQNHFDHLYIYDVVNKKEIYVCT